MDKRTGFLLLLLPALLAVKGINAQSGAADSIRHLLQTGKEDSLKVFRYYYYGELFEQTQPDSADYYFRKGLELAKKINYQNYKHDFDSWEDLGDWWLALDDAKIAIQLNPDNFAAYYLRANMYLDKKKIQSSTKRFREMQKDDKK